MYQADKGKGGEWVQKVLYQAVIFSVRSHITLLQMLTPLVCMFVPFAVFTLCVYFGLSEELYVSLLYFSLLAISLFPMTDAVLTVGFVTPYRRFTLGLLRKIVRVSPADSTTSVRATVMANNA